MVDDCMYSFACQGQPMPDLIGGFDWDAGNRDKCRKHCVSLADIEALFRGPVAVQAARPGSEERLIAVGRTAEGRSVLVVIPCEGKAKRR